MFPEERHRSGQDEVAKVIALTGCTRGAVLDLGCGPGRHAIPLTQQGFTVTGVDRTSFLLEKARERAAAAGVEIEWVQEDMRSFVRPGAFDLTISMLTSFGYFDDPKENLTVLENIFASLKPGGRFILESMGKEVLARIFEPTSSREVPGGGLFIERRKAVAEWSRMENEWLLLQGGKMTTFHISHWIYSGLEFRQMLEGVGFSDVTIYGDLLGNPYGAQAKRLIAVAGKSA
jgi:SAM-dependent methyltransferase